jgi:hypothetical protein
MRSKRFSSFESSGEARFIESKTPVLRLVKQIECLKSFYTNTVKTKKVWLFDVNVLEAKSVKKGYL